MRLKSLTIVCLILPAVVSALSMKVAKKITIAGDGDENVMAHLTVGDMNGDGQFDYIMSNGIRMAKAYDHNGNKLFEVYDKNGKEVYDPWHPFTHIVWDIDKDGKDELIHSWGSSGLLKLVARNEKGDVEKSTDLWIQDNNFGHNHSVTVMAVAYRADNEPMILVGIGNTVDGWKAYDRNLKLLWSADTPAGSHSIYPYDFDNDGVHECIFAGKYALNGDGKIMWTMSGWGGDHVDGLQAGDIDPSVPGFEVVAIGQTGTRLYDVESHELLWQVPNSVFKNPQTLALGEFDKTSPGLELVLRQRPSEPDGRAVLVSCAGKILKELPGNLAWPIMNADLDGDRSEDEVLASSADVYDKTGNVILNRNWYYESKGSGLHPHWQWQCQPFTQDILGDSREEILIWSRDCIVVGESQTGQGHSVSYRNNRNYRIRGQLSKNRAGLNFDFRNAGGPSYFEEAVDIAEIAAGPSTTASPSIRSVSEPHYFNLLGRSVDCSRAPGGGPNGLASAVDFAHDKKLQAEFIRRLAP